MKEIHTRSLLRRGRQGLLALAVVICLLLVSAVTALAASVDLHDDANVLQASQVRSAASALSYPIRIYTTNFSGSNSQFDQDARNKVSSNNVIVLAVNTLARHVFAVGGSSVPMSSGQYTSASQAFASDYRSSQNYTSATVAAIHSMGGMLNSSSNNGGVLPGPSRGIGGFGPGLLCCVGLIALLGIGFFVFMRRRGGGTGLFNRPMQPPNYDPNLNQPYNQPYQQGNYPPGTYPPGGYPPNYGPGYPQHQGMNPLAAGGLGAAAGGILGYELGKDRGEDESRNDQGYGNGGGFGGDSGGGADFGGNNAGGGTDFGGGGDSGGGADFGGGGDSGGGADFGGGGGGDFGGGGGDSGGGSGF